MATLHELQATSASALQGSTTGAGESASQPVVGIIGMGDMGRMYARRLKEGGIQTIYVCDLPEKYERLQEELKGTGIIPLPDGHAVSRLSDLVIYSVEAAHIKSCVRLYGPSTKYGATVAGQTSVKAPEKEAFDLYLPPDCAVVSLHSLHGPSVTTEGQPLIIIHHRGPIEKIRMVEDTFRCFKSRYVHLTYEEHDMVTANTQAVTHAAFLRLVGKAEFMGQAWHKSAAYPWETARYVSGIEVVKVNITLRIYSAKWHVYAGLAILNPAAQVQIQQYAKSATELFKLMVENKGEELAERVWSAREKVFGWGRGVDAAGVGKAESGEGSGNGSASGSGNDIRQPILLSEDVLDQFSLGHAERVGAGPGPGPGPGNDNRGEAETGTRSIRRQAEKESPNSHLSLLAMVDCWATLGIRPYEHLAVAGTPVFMLWIGVAEYLFRSPSLLESAIQASLSDRIHRPDDTEFVIAARQWSECVSFGNFELYRRRFEETAAFFSPRFEEATKIGSRMIKTIQDAQKATKGV